MKIDPRSTAQFNTPASQPAGPNVSFIPTPDAGGKGSGQLAPPTHTAPSLELGTQSKGTAEQSPASRLAGLPPHFFQYTSGLRRASTLQIFTDRNAVRLQQRPPRPARVEPTQVAPPTHAGGSKIVPQPTQPHAVVPNIPSPTRTSPRATGGLPTGLTAAATVAPPGTSSKSTAASLGTRSESAVEAQKLLVATAPWPRTGHSLLSTALRSRKRKEKTQAKKDRLSATRSRLQRDIKLGLAAGEKAQQEGRRMAANAAFSRVRAWTNAELSVDHRISELDVESEASHG